MIVAVTPSTADLLMKELSRDEGELKVYFPLYDGEFADYTANVKWTKDKLSYKSGGHGIGHCWGYVSSKDHIVEKILTYNEQINGGNEFHLKIIK